MCIFLNATKTGILIDFLNEFVCFESRIDPKKKQTTTTKNKTKQSKQTHQKNKNKKQTKKQQQTNKQNKLKRICNNKKYQKMSGTSHFLALPEEGVQRAEDRF